VTLKKNENQGSEKFQAGTRKFFEIRYSNTKFTAKTNEQLKSALQKDVSVECVDEFCYKQRL
jgi:hypothetical protein